MDANAGNIAFIVNNYPSKKKPTPDRKSVNWGKAQSMRGGVTLYSCEGYFKCFGCDAKAKSSQFCMKCKLQLVQKSCSAKKYVFFCKNECHREVYENCCEYEANESKLVILYVQAHNCIPLNSLNESQIISSFKPVKTVNDILDNLSTILEKEYSVEIVSKVPSDIDDQKYFILENTEKQELRDFIRDGRNWQTFTQTTSQLFSNVLNENTAKNVRKKQMFNTIFLLF